MSHYCSRIENITGDKHSLLVKYQKNLCKIVEWYQKQFETYSNMLKAELLEQLSGFVIENDEELGTFNILNDYDSSFGVKLSMFCIADILCKHMLSTFSYGPENTGCFHFSDSTLGQSWFEYAGDIYCVSEILQQLLIQSGKLGNIDLAVLQEERIVRNKLTHAGDITNCLSAIRCYNIIKRMILFVDRQYEGVLPEFEYPEAYQCDMQKFFSKNKSLGFDNNTMTTVLVVGSMHDMNQTQLELLANLPWNLVIDFDGGTPAGGLKSLVHHTQVSYKKLDMGTAQSTVSSLVLSSNYTEWLICGEYLNPYLPSQNASSYSKVEKLIVGKYAFYHGKRQDYKKYIHDLLECLCKKMAQRLNPVNIVYVYSDYLVAQELLNLCELHLDNVEYTCSAIYYWSKEKINAIVNSVYSSYIISDEDYTQRFEVFPGNISSFLTGLEKYGVGNDISIRTDLVERKLLPSSEEYKDISGNLAYNLERYFEVVYIGIGENEEDNAEQLKKFYQGGTAPWSAFYHKKTVLLIQQEEMERNINKIKTRLGRIPDRNTDKIIYLAHEPGIGGSTMLRNIGWELHQDYPVLVAHDYDKYNTKQMLTQLYDTVRKPFVVLVDENFDFLEELERDIKEIQRACVLIAAVRTNNIVTNKVEQIPLVKISQAAEKQLKRLFRENSPLLYSELSDKEEKYNDFILQDPNSMRSPFMIGLYYMDRAFNGVDEYVSKIINSVNNQKEYVIIGFMAIADIYGQESLPRSLVNRYIGIDKRENYLVSHSYMQSAFYLDNEQIVSYKSKHYLLSKKLLEQCSQVVFGADFKEKIVDWAKCFIDTILDECQSGFHEIYQVILEKIFIKNRIVNDERANQSAFSRFIEDVILPEQRITILDYLSMKSASYANQRSAEEEQQAYMMTSHFYGHLSRLYCKIGSGVANFSKAVECSELSMKYMEQSNSQDARVYHMHGETMKNELQYEWELLNQSGNKLDNSIYDNFEDKIDEILKVYDMAAQYGSPDYAYTSEISLLVNYLGVVYRHKRISQRKDLDRLSESQRQYRIDVEALIDLLDGIELDEETYCFYNRLVDKYRSDIMMNDYSTASIYYQERLSQLMKENAPTSAIINARSALINARLGKYRKTTELGKCFYTGIPANEVEEILQLLESAIEQSFDTTRYIYRQQRMSLYNRWFSIAKYSTRSIEKGIEIALKWKELTELDKRNDPRPYYYLYVLYYLSLLEGSVDNKRYVQEFQRISEQKAIQSGYKLDIIKDVIVEGKGMAQLCDIRNINDLGNVFEQPVIKFREFKGKFVEIISKKGFVELVDPLPWIKVKAKFRIMERNTLGPLQKTHDVKFYAGFSYELLTVIDSTIKDLTVGEDFPEIVEIERDQNIFEDKKVTTYKFYPEYISYDFSRSNVFYLNGQLENGKFASLKSNDIDRYGDELEPFGRVEDVMEELKEKPFFDVCIVEDIEFRCKVSLYKTGVRLSKLLYSVVASHEGVRNISDSKFERGNLVPDIVGNVILKNCVVSRERINGVIEVEGIEYPATLPSLSRKKVKELAGKRSINARIKGKNNGVYILQL